MSQRSKLFDTAGYWINFAGVLAFWVFALYVCSVMLSMSARGRLHGGLFLNVAMSLYVLVFLGGVTAYLVAVWKWRHLEEKVQLNRLARLGASESHPRRTRSSRDLR